MEKTDEEDAAVLIAKVRATLVRLRAYLQRHPRDATTSEGMPLLAAEFFEFPPFSGAAGGFDTRTYYLDLIDYTVLKAITAEKLNAASDRPLWAPISESFPVLDLWYIALDDRVRNQGFGRQLCNILMQRATRTTGAPAHVAITKCHFPIFFTVDSHYGWLRSKYVRASTPAGLIYPRHLNTSRPGNVEINKLAVHQFTNLLWSAPLVWANARIDAFGPRAAADKEFAPLMQSLVTRANAFLDSRPHPTATFVNRVILDVLVRSALFPRGRESVARAVADHCRDMGNDDPVDAQGVVVITSDLALSLERDYGRSGHSGVAAAIFLSFLVDHSRVLYRPIVMDNDAAAQLCRLMNLRSLHHMLEDNGLRTLLPQPAPYFVHVDTTHWMWVPVAKPHSSTYDGKTYVPLPLAEPMPMWVEEALGERPTKRARPTLDCLHCRTKHEAVHGQMAFCSSACSTAYYE